MITQNSSFSIVAVVHLSFSYSAFENVWEAGAQGRAAHVVSPQACLQGEAGSYEPCDPGQRRGSLNH